jgi:hypothetical protein
MYLTISAEKVLILLTEWKFWLPLKTWSSIISRTTSSNSRVQKFRFLHAFHKFAYCLFHVRSVRPALKKFLFFWTGMGIPILPACLVGRWWRHGSVSVRSMKPCIHTNKYIPVQTSTYQYILVSSCTRTYQYIPVHTSIFKYIPVHTCMYQYVPVHTSIYWYVPVHTSTSLSLEALL